MYYVCPRNGTSVDGRPARGESESRETMLIGMTASSSAREPSHREIQIYIFVPKTND